MSKNLESGIGWLLPSCYNALQREDEKTRAVNKQLKSIGEVLLDILQKGPYFKLWKSR